MPLQEKASAAQLASGRYIPKLATTSLHFKLHPGIRFPDPDDESTADDPQQRGWSSSRLQRVQRTATPKFDASSLQAKTRPKTVERARSFVRIKHEDYEPNEDAEHDHKYDVYLGELIATGQTKDSESVTEDVAFCRYMVRDRNSNSRSLCRDDAVLRLTDQRLAH